MTDWDVPELVDVPTLRDDLGSLGVVEGQSPFPFPIKRVYFIHSVTPGAVRGSHAHKALYQLIIAVSGSLVVQLDDGTTKTEWTLDSAAKGLKVPPGFWRTLYNFTPGSAAIVFASEEYLPSDYIRDYDEFLEWVNT
jgi:dTDP-4-dehydrorhamnose 3,5-epimerase-like enzyme